jgi:6-pyruvoyltetrahydropterin/6-carboxytetrahydropterin synthase
MADWIIDKEFSFAYGHRVWTQKLFADYADDLKCACRHLHGHEAKVQVFLTAKQLNNTGMVTDFRHLEWLKRWFNAYVDHRFIIDRMDPLAKNLLDAALGQPIVLQPVTAGPENVYAGQQIKLDVFKPNTPEFEMAEGMLIVDFVPTSENLSKWVSDIVEPNMSKLGVKVHHVDWWETPRSRSTFINS